MYQEHKKYRIIAVDFDGTLCTDSYPDIGFPNFPLINLLKELKKEDKQIVLWTCRCGEKLMEAERWCKSLGLEFDAINENLPRIKQEYGTDSRKIYADVYIDDKSCFPWKSENEWRKIK